MFGPFLIDESPSPERSPGPSPGNLIDTLNWERSAQGQDVASLQKQPDEHQDQPDSHQHNPVKDQEQPGHDQKLLAHCQKQAFHHDERTGRYQEQPLQHQKQPVRHQEQSFLQVKLPDQCQKQPDQSPLFVSEDDSEDEARDGTPSKIYKATPHFAPSLFLSPSRQHPSSASRLGLGLAVQDLDPPPARPQFFFTEQPYVRPVQTNKIFLPQKPRKSIKMSEERHYWFDPVINVRREIWRPGDGDGDPDTERTGLIKDKLNLKPHEFWRFYQSSPVTNGHKIIDADLNMPPKYVLLDDLNAYAILNSNIPKRQLTDYWPHDFSGMGFIRATRYHRGRGAVGDPDAEGNDRYFFCLTRTTNNRYYFSGQKDYQPIVYNTFFPTTPLKRSASDTASPLSTTKRARLSGSPSDTAGSSKARPRYPLKKDSLRIAAPSTGARPNTPLKQDSSTPKQPNGEATSPLASDPKYNVDDDLFGSPNKNDTASVLRDAEKKITELKKELDVVTANNEKQSGEIDMLKRKCKEKDGDIEDLQMMLAHARGEQG